MSAKKSSFFISLLFLSFLIITARPGKALSAAGKTSGTAVILVIILWLGSLGYRTVQKQISLLLKFQTSICSISICICLLHSCLHLAHLHPGHKSRWDRHHQET